MLSIKVMLEILGFDWDLLQRFYSSSICIMFSVQYAWFYAWGIL